MITDHETIVGTEVISGGIFEWKLRVNKLKYTGDCWHICVGVINIDRGNINYLIQASTFISEPGCYTFDVNYGHIVREYGTSQTFDKKVTKSGDIIEIKLDLDNKSLHCKVNGEDVGNFIDKLPDGEYRLVANLWFDETEIEIL